MIPCAKSLTEYFRYSRQFYHLIFDVHGNCSYGNFLFQQNFQYASLSNEEQNKFVWGINNCLEKSTTVVTVETTLRSRQGNFVSVQWELSPIKNEDEDGRNFASRGVHFKCRFGS